jgi:AcrR family transcriptional regulator
MPRSSRAESAATRLRLLDVARRQFASQGYADTSLDAVAVAAGVTRGAVYHHFADKRALFLAVLAQEQEAVAATVERDAMRHPEPWEQLRAGCLAFLDTATADDRARILLVDGPAVAGWAAWRDLDAAQSGRHLQEALEAVSAELRVAPALVPTVAQILSGALNEAALLIADAPGDARVRKRARAGAMAVLDGLRRS